MAELVKPLLLALVLAVAIGFALPFIFANHMSGMAVIGLIMAAWIAIATVQELRLRIASREQKLPALVKLGRSHWGMVLGHVGFAVVIIGIALVQNYEVERTVRMAPGDTFVQAPYSFTFKSLKHREGSNWISDAAKFEISRHDKVIGTVLSEKRFYTIQRQIQTKTALQVNPLRDLYIAMGEELGDGSWAVRIQIKPFVRWIWFGGVLMALGGLLSMTDKRYRLQRKKIVPVQAKEANV